MPTPALTASWPEVIEALRVWDALPEPKSVKAVSEAMGRPSQSVGRWLRCGLEDRNRDPAIKAAAAAIGTGMTPRLVWAKTKDEDGTSYSVLLKPEQENIIDRVATAFADLEPAAVVPAPKVSDDDLMTLFPIFDFHLGMLSWGQETGEAYDTTLAMARLREGVSRCLHATSKGAVAVILNGGDFTHANDQTNQTPRSKHALDVDTRHWRTIEAAVQVSADVIELALARFQKVIYRALPGNHDPQTAAILTFALAERYRGNLRVEVVKEPTEFFALDFGKVMLAAHHGDKAKADRLVMHMADEWPEMWGRTRFRYYWTGHLHHHKSADIGGVLWEQLQAISPRDAWAATHAYSARASMQAVTYHRQYGEVGRTRWPFAL